MTYHYALGTTGTNLTVDVLAGASNLLAAGVASGTDLSALPAVAGQSSLRLRANLSTTVFANTPRLDDWYAHWLGSPEALSPGWNTLRIVAQDTAVPPNITAVDHAVFLATMTRNDDGDGLPDQ